MNQRTIFILLCCLLFSMGFRLSAQDLLRYIPQDAVLVVHLNPASINAKVNFESLKKLEFWDKMTEEFSREINSSERTTIQQAIQQPSKYGMDFNSDSYFFIRSTADGTYFSYLFSLTDADRFAGFVKNNLLNAEKGLHINTEKGMTLASSGSGTIAWNGEVAVLNTVKLERDYGYLDYEDYDYEDIETWAEEDEVVEEETEIPEEEIIMEKEKPEEEIVEEEPEEEWEEEHGGESDEEFAQRQSEAIESFTSGLFAIPADSTIRSNVKFNALRNDRNDVSLWFDYDFINQLDMSDLAYMDPSMKSFMNAYRSLASNSNVALSMNFDPGAIEVDYDVVMNPRWTRYLKASLDAKINPKFAKYIRGDNLLGYFSVSYNMENMLREGKNLVMPLLESIPYAGPMAPEIIDILDIFIDEEAIYEFFKGDFVFAVTGMREFESTMITYEFDEEFNQKEVEKTKKRTLPEYVMLLSYGNEENLKKFFRLGEKSKSLERMGNLYRIRGANHFGMDLFLCYRKGILFFTNNSDLVFDRMASGYSSRERISKRHRKLMKNNAHVTFWDIPKSLNTASELGLPFGDTGTEVVNVGKQSLESVLITTPREINNSSFHTDLSFRFANREMNSLEQFCYFLNDIYLASMGGKSM